MTPLLLKHLAAVCVDTFTNLFLHQALEALLVRFMADHFKCSTVLLQCYGMFWGGRMDKV